VWKWQNKENEQTDRNKERKKDSEEKKQEERKGTEKQNAASARRGVHRRKREEQTVEMEARGHEAGGRGSDAEAQVKSQTNQSNVKRNEQVQSVEMKADESAEL